MHKKKWILAALLSVILPSGLLSQDFPAREPDGILSPEISGEKVVFRFYADFASEVFLDGDWLDSPRLMQKMPGGVWEFHMSGMRPGMYSYRFIVDGEIADDPHNSKKYRDGSRIDSYFYIEGPATARFKHSSKAGTLLKTCYYSSILKSDRNISVYLPAEYDSNQNKNYPVLYLLHDESGDWESWANAGMAPQILDHLIGAGRAVPMIVVMPDCSGNVSDNLLMSSIMNEIIPFVESRYRALRSETKRGIAGIGAGGRLAIQSSIMYLNKFDYIGALSCGVEDNGHLVDDFLKVKQSRIRLFWVGCGRLDNMSYNPSKLLHDTLSYIHLDHSFYLGNGGYDWSSWRQFFYTFAPLIFKYYTD